MKNIIMKNTIKYPLICTTVVTLTAGLSGCGSSQKDATVIEIESQRAARFASVETDVEKIVASSKIDLNMIFLYI